MFLIVLIVWLVLWDCRLWTKLKHAKHEKPYGCAIIPGSGFYYYIKRQGRIRQQRNIRRSAARPLRYHPPHLPTTTTMTIHEWLTSVGLSEYSEQFQANHIELNTLPSLNADDLKEIGVESLGHRKKLLEEIQKLTTSDALYNTGDAASATEQAPLLGGLWFNEHGSFYYVPDRDDPNTPFRILSHFIKQVAPYQHEIAEWIAQHYPGQNAAQDDLVQFWKNLSVVMLDRGGWYLAWKGVIYARHDACGKIAAALKQVPEGVNDLEWQPDAIVTLMNIHSPDKPKPCKWAVLTGAEPGGLDLEDTDEELEAEFGSDGDGMLQQ